MRFNNGKFRILQLSDMQDTYVTSPDTVNLTREIIKITKPDLIVLTGDQVKGYGFYFSFGDNKKNAETTLTTLLEPIAESEIPFTAVFGNHDAFGEADREYQWSLYKKYDNFIGNDYKTECIEIFSEDGSDVPFCVYLFDSGDKRKDGSYDIISKEQISAYKEKRDSLKEKYSHYVNALAFQHIPPVEIYESLQEVPKRTKGAVQGARKFSDKYYVLPEYVKNGFMKENAASPDEKSGQIEAFKEHGDVLGLYFGHDHNNSFIVKHGDLDLGYTQGCGFNIYGPGLERGGRVFDIDETDTSVYRTFTVTYKDMLGHKLVRPVKDFAYTHSPSSLTQAKKAIKKAAAIIAAVAVPSTVYSIIKRNK